VSGSLDVRTRHGWRALRPDAAPPAVAETDPVELRGLPPGAAVRIGPTDVVAGEDGRARLRPMDDDRLRGHVGLVPVAIGGRVVGEVRLVPDKLSEDAYQQLRADLQRVWGDLVHDPGGVTALDTAPPPARELWRRIDHAVVDILASPHEHLRVGTGVRRLERVQHRRELQPAVVRAGRRGRAALTRTLERTTDTPENHLVGATLRLLHQHARHEPGADDVVRRIERLLRDPLLAATPTRPLRRVTWGMRSDPRYRQVLSVHQVLHRPELDATTGPGELRRGVTALPTLYEWWVFLQVLVAATGQYGPPLPPGIEALAVRRPGRRPRLELPAGATVTFPGPVHVAYEPQITARGDGWMGLEYVPHPDPDRFQAVATPDVVVFRAGSRPWLTVIDAKYVGRGFVEGDAARAHEKYARMRWRGEPVVRNVVVAHPHEGLSFQWAGYGAVTVCPGGPIDRFPLPLPLTG
jgi:hypothetical protein